MVAIMLVVMTYDGYYGRSHHGNHSLHRLKHVYFINNGKKIMLNT
jgi:hypothetical protein